VKSEQAIQKTITKAIEQRGGWCCKTITCNKSGVPDILAVIDGKFIAVEVKTPKGKTSPIQEYQIKKIQESGGTAIVARSVEDFLKCL
jgi:Holliday junction resolvase